MKFEKIKFFLSNVHEREKYGDFFEMDTLLYFCFFSRERNVKFEVTKCDFKFTATQLELISQTLAELQAENAVRKTFQERKPVGFKIEKS